MSEPDERAFPDRTRLRDLSVRYAAAVDDGDGHGLAALFDGDATLRMFRPGDGEQPSVDLHGTEDLRGIPDRLRTRYAATMHLLGQSSYAIDGDRASGDVYCLAHHIESTPHGGVDHVMYIRYADEYRRAATGVWRFVTRVGRVSWTETRAVDAVPGNGRSTR